MPSASRCTATTGPTAAGRVVSGRDPQRDPDGVLRRGGLPRAAVRVPDLHRPGGEHRRPHPGADLRARDAARGAGTAVVHADHRAGHRPRGRLADRHHRRNRRRVPRACDHARGDLPDDGPRRQPRRRAPRPRTSSGGVERPRAGGCSGRARRTRPQHERRSAGGRHDVARPPVALYVHVPFCVSLCPYCDFVVYAGAAARGPRARVDALHRRAAGRDPAAGRRCSMRRSARAAAAETLYIGGGTPTLLPRPRSPRLIALVRERFGIAADAEVTIEANPGPTSAATPGRCARGVNRLSMGAQSFDAGELRRLGRRHGPADVAAAVAAARDAGISRSRSTSCTTSPAQTRGDLGGLAGRRAGARAGPRSRRTPSPWTTPRRRA